MRAFGPRNSAYAFLDHDRHTDIYIYKYISREISIEHPSVGLASLAQLHADPCNKAYLGEQSEPHTGCSIEISRDIYIYVSVVGRCISWTLDSGLDHGLDRGLDGGLDFGPKFGPSFGL